MRDQKEINCTEKCFFGLVYCLIEIFLALSSLIRYNIIKTYYELNEQK